MRMSEMETYGIKINDGYTTWVYELEGPDDICIRDLVNNAIKGTGLKIIKDYWVEDATGFEGGNT